MKKLIFSLLLLGSLVFGQITQIPSNQYNYVAVDPSNPCTVGQPSQFNYVLNKIWGCINSVWVITAGGEVMGPTRSMMIFGNTGTGTVSASSTAYFLPWSSGFGTVQANSQFIVPFTGFMKFLKIQTASAQSGSGTLVVTVQKCTPTSGACTGSDTALTFTVSAGAAANEFSDTVNTVSVTNGDLISIKLVQGTGTSAQIRAFSLLIVSQT